MFTGLIERVGTFGRLSPRGNGAVLSITHDPWPGPLTMGESVSVQGACLTVTDIAPDHFSVDVLNETLQRTSMGGLKPGARLNLERALRVGDRMGGHMVSGHVDGCGTVERITQSGDDHLIRVACDPGMSREIVCKGSIALDGISLTVTAEAPGWFEVAVIPHTWRETSLPARRSGDRVNIETDMLAKYVGRCLAARDGRRDLTMAQLEQAGIA